MSEKEKKIVWDELSPDDKLKYEIAEELGLLEKVKESGWKSLSAKETGRIGGLMTKKKREKNLECTYLVDLSPNIIGYRTIS